MTKKDAGDRKQRRPGPPGRKGEDASGRAPPPDPQAGFDREVGDLEDPDAPDNGALPGRAGGGLAGG